MSEQGKIKTVKGRYIKLENRRAFLGKTGNGSYVLQFKRLDKTLPKGERIVATSLCLSSEAMDAIVKLYGLQNPYPLTITRVDTKVKV